jgi:predicted Rossmann fold flavoprotein
LHVVCLNDLGRGVNSPELETADLVVVGAGAAGLATAVFAARADPSLRIRCLDGSARIGAKILVSGGSRCNVTNRIVTEHDFWGGSSRVVRHVLRAFPAANAVEFFESLGVALHEEEDGKLFPDSNRSRTVLDALLSEAARVGVGIVTGTRVESVERAAAGFVVRSTAGHTVHAGRLVLATGGRSLPKTGSDGRGYAFAQAFGHRCVDTTPALVPLVLAGAAHPPLAGVAHQASLTLRVDGELAVQLEGSLLWTHFGISGPVALNMSRHWLRAIHEDGRQVTVAVNVLPGWTFESTEQWWLAQAKARPRAQVSTVLATVVPAALAVARLASCAVAGETTMAHVSRDERRRLIRHATAMPLAVRDSRGYNYAEVTAGGVALDEIDPATMESRLCPGLYLVGEILDVDGRLGGFNFQWAWSSAWVASRAIARAISSAVTRK